MLNKTRKIDRTTAILITTIIAIIGIFIISITSMVDMEKLERKIEYLERSCLNV